MLEPGGGQWLAHAEAQLEARHLGAALAGFNEAEQHGADPDRCGGGRWQARMLQGNFEAAWRESDALRARNAPDPHRYWEGQRLEGKRVMLRCLHGFGDAIQFLRYVPRLRRRVASLTIQVHPRLLPLVPHLDGVESVMTWGAGAAEPPWDVQMEVMELPYLFRTRCRELPLATQYLRVPRLVNAPCRAGEARPRVGVVWGAGDWCPSRSIPLAVFSNCLAETRCEFCNLQGGPAREQAQQVPAAASMVDTPECAEDLLSLAQTMASLDLVITVDTLAAHLAGAMGKPAWVLLPYAADWRWMTARDDSPWYPTLRLLRQPHPGDWKSVLQTVKEGLSLWLNSEVVRQRA